MEISKRVPLTSITDEQVGILHDNYRKCWQQLQEICDPTLIDQYIQGPNLTEITDVMKISMYLSGIKENVFHLDSIVNELMKISLFRDNEHINKQSTFN